MKSVRHSFSGAAEIRIEIFSDLHIGSKKCDYKAIKEKVARVQLDPNTYCILLGDIINNTTKTSVGDVYEEPLSPMNQIKKAIELLSPIKEKILGITAGNHERRTMKQDGADLTYFLALELGLEDRYDYAGVLLFLGFDNHGGSVRGGNNVMTTLYMTHGDGNNGGTIGGKANGLKKRGDIVNADIIVTGHTHAPLTFREQRFEVEKTKCNIVAKETVFVNASAALEYEEYAELYGMKPSSTVSPIIKVSPKWRKNEITILL